MENSNQTIMKLTNGNILVRTNKGIRICQEKDYKRTHPSIKVTQDGRGK